MSNNPHLVAAPTLQSIIVNILTFTNQDMVHSEETLS